MNFAAKLRARSQREEHQGCRKLDLPYHLIGGRKECAFRNYEHPTFKTRLHSANKKGCPILHLNEGSSLQAVALDVDTEGPWVGMQLAEALGEEGLVLQSAGGRWKVLIFVDGFASKELDDKKTEAFVNELIDARGLRDMPGLDVSWGGRHYCFVNATMWELIEGYVQNGGYIWERQEFLDFFPEPQSQEPNTAYIVPNASKHLYFKAIQTEFRPKIQATLKAGTKGSGIRLDILQILTAMHGLLKDDGFAISSKKIAEQLNCSPSTVLAYLRQLINLGYLECIDETHTYVGNPKAKRYKACSELYKEIQAHKKQKKACTKKLPTTIADGKWFEAIYHSVPYFHSTEHFMSWLNTIPGAFEKDRQQKAISWARCYFRRRALKGLSNREET